MTKAAYSPGADRTGLIRKAHRINAIALSGFIAIHMLTHVSGLWGIDAYNNVQSALRTIYRFPPFEIALLASITAQLVLGMVLLVARLRQGRPQGFWSWLQILSGGAFFIFMAQHLYSFTMARVYFDLDTNFYWPASVMSGPWFIYYFWPYYMLGVFALFAHAAAGVRFALLDRGAISASRRWPAALIAAGAVLAVIIPPIIAGAFYAIDLPQEWIDYLRFYMSDFEPW